MRLDFSAIGFLEFACYAVIFGFFWRTLAAKFHDHPVGQAMAYIY